MNAQKNGTFSFTIALAFFRGSGVDSSHDKEQAAQAAEPEATQPSPECRNDAEAVFIGNVSHPLRHALLPQGQARQVLEGGVTKKHFIALAKIFANNHPVQGEAVDIQYRDLADEVANYLGSQNPLFDRAQFLSACGF